MSKSSKLPQILLVGQPNAGKSTLFNRLMGQRRAIVSSTAQTTRDLLRGTCTIGEQTYEIVDSAGLIKSKEELATASQQLSRDAIAKADIVLLVVDGTVEPSPLEHELSRTLHRTKSRVIVVANKIDSKAAQRNLENWRRLGFELIVPISALHNIGIADLTDQITTMRPGGTAPQSTKPLIKVAIIGKPNAGKSSMLNSLAGKELAITSEIPNTTRDINYYQLDTEAYTIEFADTAGLSRAGKRKTDVEFYASVRTKRALEQADIGLVLIDSTEYRAAMQKKLAGLVKDTHRGLIIVVTKSDLIEDELMRRTIERSISHNFQFTWWAPLIFTSTQKPKSFRHVLEQIVKSYTNYTKQVPTRELNQILQRSVVGHPPAGMKNARIHLNYITQTDSKPPTFTIFGSKASAMHFSYLRFLENQFREAIDFVGTPIKLEFRSKYKDGDETPRWAGKSRRKI